MDSVHAAVDELRKVVNGLGVKAQVGYMINEEREPIGLILRLRLRNLSLIPSIPSVVNSYPVSVKVEDVIDLNDKEQTAPYYPTR